MNSPVSEAGFGIGASLKGMGEGGAVARQPSPTLFAMRLLCLVLKPTRHHSRPAGFMPRS
jgi:hypothetical protein